MLVRTFQVHVSLTGRVINDAALAQCEGVGRSGIEPDVQNVGHLLPLMHIHARAEQVGFLSGEPCVDATIADGF